MQGHSLRHITLVLLAAALGCVSTARAAQWVWGDGREVGGEVFTTTKTFDAPGAVEHAELCAAADFASLEARVNGERVGSIAPHGVMLRIDVTRHLQPGENNRVTLIAHGVEGPSAVAARLRIRRVDGSSIDIATDKSWVTYVPERRIIDTVERGDLSAEPWWDLRPITINELDDYTQWKQAIKAERGADPASFHTLLGYEVEMLRSAGDDEGSWISMTFDPQGRIAIGREDAGILRYTLDKPGGRIVRSETINDTLKEVRGLLFAHDALYVSASESQAVFRLRDATGDDRYKEVEKLFDMPGGRGHGRNDLALGPDDMIYLISGDAVKLPEGDDVDDRTSPHRAKFKPFRPNDGHVLRFDADGRRREVYCAGLRNPYGIAFNRHGEAFTYDADAEHDMGSPWYRPTRVLQLVSGADYGWRAVTGSWPPYYPDHEDNAPHAVQIGKGSPTGVKFGTRAAFPQAYREALYVLDWTYGRILAVHLRQSGAGYRGQPEVFLRGRPMNVTDLAFGPDGAMYFVTGGRKTKSALYRVRYTGKLVQAPEPTAQQKARKEFSDDARATRRALDAYHGTRADGAVDAAWDHLGSADPRLRYAARIALEHQPVDAWRDRALGEADPLHRITALTALINADPAAAPDALRRVLDLDVAALPLHQRQRALNVITMCIDRVDALDAGLRDVVIAKLSPLYPAPTRDENWQLAALLHRMEDAVAVPKTMALLARESQQRQQMHYLFVLRTARDGWTDTLRRDYFTHLGAATSYLGGRGLPDFVKRITTDALASLPNDEARQAMQQIIADATKPPPMPDLAARKFVRNWTMADLTPHLDTLNDATAKRDLDNGRRMFDQALCSQCHRVGAHGRAIGPDLTAVASRFGPRDILEAIVEPNKVVADNYHTDVLVMKDGKTLTGQVVPQLDYRAGELLLAPNPLAPDQTVTVSKADIAEHRKSELSLMPPGLINTLTADDVLDLLAWLRTGGK